MSAFHLQYLYSQKDLYCAVFLLIFSLMHYVFLGMDLVRIIKTISIPTLFTTATQSACCHINSAFPTCFVLYFSCLLAGRLCIYGGRGINHQSPSDWQFNLIHTFHLLGFTSNATDNAHIWPAHVQMVYWMCACVCIFGWICIPGYLKMPLRAFLLPYT